MNLPRSFILILLTLFLNSPIIAKPNPKALKVKKAAKYDRDYTLQTTILGYYSPEGKRNPVLQAKKGETVRIKIVNGELMTHDIALEKIGVKSKVLVEKGDTASVVFKATQSDTYFCTIPGHRAAGMVGKFEVVAQIAATEETIAGIIPKKTGKALNVNFEKGSLLDWTSEGDAFTNPLVSSDPSPMHEKDMPINKSGKYFVSSGGTKNYKRTGTLTSVPFTVTQPFASFKVSGGALQDTRVELVRADNKEVFFQITGSGRATLQPVVVDLSPVMNKDIFIRLVDNETGISTIPYIKDDIWAHINFDDFQFHATRPNFTNELKQSDIIILPPLDPVTHSGLSGIEAAKAMTLAPGFSVKLAASEPEIIRPISFTIDAKGRLWVAEAHTYPVRAPEGQGKDRILIFEDTNGDGTLDSRKVFTEGLNLISAIEIGMGGVWLGSAPHLLFIPIDKTGDKPAGPPQILLDGWGYEDTHEMLNNFRWGPDGWLYGTHGVFTKSNVGKPGAPDSERTKLNAGVWRFHPTTKKFELFAEGTSNPWGIDWNDYGHSFITVCVIPHMFHVIQGARYQRQAGEHFNKFTYDDIKQSGDHVHWIGDRGPHAGNFRSNAKGGGHAHAGAMIYLGSENWPKELRNQIFMNNIHGSRINMDLLNPKGSGYQVGHGKDFLETNDTWSQWLNFRYDASGSVFAIDWYDKNQCHSSNPDVHQKTMGRIFKISHESDKFVQVDLTKASDMELVNYQLYPNEWYVRNARLILQERGPNKKVHKALKKILNENQDPTRKLRALWALHVTKGSSEKELLALLDNDNEHVRSWAIQLLAEDKNLSEAALKRFAEMAKNDKSAVVRLYLASAIQRTTPEKRWETLAALMQHEEDKEDHNLPLMLWYAFEPTVPTDMNKALEVAQKAKVPNILPYTVKRISDMKSAESLKTLQGFQQRLDANDHSHQSHELQALLKKALESK
ncbi:dehydrogenase [Adhaeribacter arboris]|uniref:Dehydrogenase n=1 Tax=Adhaeribacter arboris TaxID=2072846 RepID=A0A2T2YD04_9BACT|nr:PVC-type heme-binding CxxCH protein [Adhaeribacter arboris]PSR53402.1 dehydrogenase [Adhaeribacter arboris]